jgi:hypothetical protein
LIPAAQKKKKKKGRRNYTFSATNRANCLSSWPLSTTINYNVVLPVFMMFTSLHEICCFYVNSLVQDLVWSKHSVNNSCYLIFLRTAAATCHQAVLSGNTGKAPGYGDGYCRHHD